MTVAFWMVTRFNSLVRIHLARTDCLLCPICAYELDISGMDLTDYLWGGACWCKSCSVHFGAETIPDLRGKIEFDEMAVWDTLRMEWLKRHDWDAALVQRVEKAFDIKIDIPN